MRDRALSCVRRVAQCALIGLALASPAQAQGDGPAASAPGASGLPVPRYVSLKSDRVNMRNGPGTDYPTAWVYRRAGLPLEVIKEYEGWRQVRDADGAAGWVLQSFLSGRRTALVLPWELKAGTAAPKVALRYDDSERSRAVAMVEAGVIANVGSCDGRWCHVTIEKFHGYIEQKKLWGVYEGEVIQ
jgi:SH3-like domain-containing protein